MKKKILSLALSMLMVLAMLPATAFAATSISDNIDEPALEKAAIAALGKEDEPDYVLRIKIWFFERFRIFYWT